MGILVSGGGAGGNGTVTSGGITDATAVGVDLLTATDAADALTTLGIAAVAAPAEGSFFVGEGGAIVEKTLAETKTILNVTRKPVVVQVVADADDVLVSHVAYFRAPSVLNSLSLLRVGADVTTAGTTNATTIQVRNMTAHSANDALSVAASIASGGTLATDGTVDTNYASCATNDLWKISVTGVSTTAPKGLRVTLEFA